MPAEIPFKTCARCKVWARMDPEAQSEFIRSRSKLRLGDKIERTVKSIAVALKADCLDPDGKLKPKSRCAKVRDGLNEVL